MRETRLGARRFLPLYRYAILLEGKFYNGCALRDSVTDNCSPSLAISATPPRGRARRATSLRPSRLAHTYKSMCALRDSNSRPFPCKGIALPTELSARFPTKAYIERRFNVQGTCYSARVMPQLSESAFRKLFLALALYLTSLFAANTLGLKVMPFLFGSHLSVAVFSFPIVFLMTDVVGEVYGKRVAKLFVLAGFVSTALWIGYSLLSLALPWAEGGLWAKEGYEQMFGVSVRIAVASLAAFLIAEYQDVLSFFFFKRWFGEKMFWLRSNLSNIWSQFLDSAIFMVIAFLPVPFIPFLAEGYELPVLISLTVTWWLYKVAMGVLYTPLSYIGIWFLRKKNNFPRSHHEHLGNTDARL